MPSSVHTFCVINFYVFFFFQIILVMLFTKLIEKHVKHLTFFYFSDLFRAYRLDSHYWSIGVPILSPYYSGRRIVQISPGRA